VQLPAFNRGRKIPPFKLNKRPGNITIGPITDGGRKIFHARQASNNDQPLNYLRY